MVYPPPDDPDFAGYDRKLGNHVHDWRTYVGSQTRAIWDTFTADQREAIASDAQDLADNEEWD